VTSDNPFDWKDRTTADYFAKKRVVLFSLPGAFTPTCSTSHLPGFENAYEKLGSLGIDDVYCLSVNDAFVMRQWGLAQGLAEDKTVGSLGFEKVKLIPDGACAFTRGMGMSSTWDTNRGFGERSWRYAAIVDDGKIEKLWIEVCRASKRKAKRQSFACASLRSSLVTQRAVIVLVANPRHKQQQGGEVVQNSDPDPFEVSNVETILEYLESK